MKSICALVHRDDLDRRAFQDHYEKDHAPLAARHFPFSRYARNHFIDAEELGYDTISEFWADDIAAMTDLMNGSTGVIMRADEEQFMNRARTAPASSDEHVLSGGDPTLSDGTRVAALIDWQISHEDGQQLALAWGKKYASSMGGVSIDLTSSWRQPPFPSRAVLWAPQRCRVDPDDELQIRWVRCRRIETPAQDLGLLR
jgi:uncharacterized protein (TIGR02118 family)